MKALIVGLAGQDGSYLAEQLVDAGHDVVGLVRRRFDNAAVPVVLGDLLDQDSLEAALRTVKPDVVFNLAAVTAPGQGWGPQPPLLAEVTGLGVLKLLDAMVRAAPAAKLVHASSSAIYDLPRYGVYGLAKQFAHEAVVGYRQRRLVWCSNAVLFSHTSPRQDPRFLARRICTAATSGRMTLGDVDSRRDWSYAPDVCRALTVIAAQDSPGDWAVQSGTHSVGELAAAAAAAAGRSWDDVFTVDPSAPRVPHEGPAQHPPVQELGWRPMTPFASMVELIVRDADDCSPAHRPG